MLGTVKNLQKNPVVGWVSFDYTFPAGEKFPEGFTRYKRMTVTTFDPKMIEQAIEMWATQYFKDVEEGRAYIYWDKDKMLEDLALPTVEEKPAPQRRRRGT